MPNANMFLPVEAENLKRNKQSSEDRHPKKGMKRTERANMLQGKQSPLVAFPSPFLCWSSFFILKLEKTKPFKTSMPGNFIQTPEPQKSSERLWNGFLSLDDLLPLWENPESSSGSRKIVGLDWGTKRIGVAISDRNGLIASPLTTILYRQNGRLPPQQARTRLRLPPSMPLRKSDIELLEATLTDLLNVIEKEAPLLAVGLGVPLNLNGSFGFQSERVLAFAQHLRTCLAYPLILYDERWSSQAVERLMIAADRTRSQRKKVIDATAAAYVLQGVLDRLNLYSGEE